MALQHRREGATGILLKNGEEGGEHCIHFPQSQGGREGESCPLSTVSTMFVLLNFPFCLAMRSVGMSDPPTESQGIDLEYESDGKPHLMQCL